MNIISSEQLLDFIQNYQSHLSIIVMLVAFLESFVIIGFFLPGSLILFSIGTMIAPAELNVMAIILGNYIGAVLGYNASFFIGHIFQRPLQHTRFYQQHLEMFQYAEQFFQRYDGISVALGRFFGPLRATVPTVAGMLGMSPRLFLLINLLSALIWAPLYILSGFFLGKVITNLDWVNYLPVLSLLVILYFLIHKRKEKHK